MKLLYVYGNNCSAIEFERKYNPETIYNDMVTNEVDHILLENNKERYIEVERYEFKSVDPKFIQFIMDNIANEDKSENSKFYII